MAILIICIIIMMIGSALFIPAIKQKNSPKSTNIVFRAYHNIIKKMGFSDQYINEYFIWSGIVIFIFAIIILFLNFY